MDNASNRRGLVALGVAAMLVVGPIAWAAKRPGCAKVSVSSAQERRRAAADKFSVLKTLDLTFTVVFDGELVGEHTVGVHVFTPGGFLYQVLDVPIATPGRAAGERQVAGYPRPVAERHVRESQENGQKELAVDIPFPVAGTAIVSNGLYGRWRAQVYIDGERQPCAPAQYFTLSP
jgi:hypothetical protein